MVWTNTFSSFYTISCFFKMVANKDFGHQRKWILTHQEYTTCLLMPDFQPCPPFQSEVIEQFIKWVWLGLKTVIIVKMMLKNTNYKYKFATFPV